MGLNNEGIWKESLFHYQNKLQFFTRLIGAGQKLIIRPCQSLLYFLHDILATSLNCTLYSGRNGVRTTNLTQTRLSYWAIPEGYLRIRLLL